MYVLVWYKATNSPNFVMLEQCTQFFHSIRTITTKYSPGDYATEQLFTQISFHVMNLNLDRCNVEHKLNNREFLHLFPESSGFPFLSYLIST